MTAYHRFYSARLLLTLLLTLVLAACQQGTDSGNSGSRNNDGIWHPAPGTSWQWQLTGNVDTSVDVAMYDIDLFDTPQTVIDQLHASGRTVICYFSAGSWEQWRPDAADFPAAVLGNTLSGWPDEKWLDIRDINTLAPIIGARLDLAVQKNCDGVEPDNIDGYTNNSGFPLTAGHQLSYNIWLAEQAHARGLSIGLKNDLDQVTQLEPHFDWALNEQCFQYNECNLLLPFIDAGKAVFGVEYNGASADFCPQANAMNFDWLKKNLDLDSWREACRNQQTNPLPVAAFLIALSPTGANSIDVDASSSSDDTGIMTYTWDFGDGTVVDAGSTTSHTYQNPGSYTVTLTVTDTSSQTASHDSVISIGSLNAAPVARINVSARTGVAPLNIVVDGLASTDDGGISSYQWDFGDGTTAAGQSTAHDYTNAGVYTLTLRVTDDEGITGSSSITIAVNGDTPGSSVWQPSPGTSWQWQLTGNIDTSFDVQMYDIDLFDTSQAVIDKLHADGRIVICYFSAGSWEQWRPDAADFPAAVLGNTLSGWPDEKWLDIRNIATLGPVIEARLDLAVRKKCDGVEPDNIDGYTNNAGFPLRAQDQLNYNKWLAEQAHARGLSIGLKNDLDQVQALEPYFDWALNEQCFQYNECELLLPFIEAGKAVFGVEYSGKTSNFCPKANAMNLDWLKKGLNLGAAREACR